MPHHKIHSEDYHLFIKLYLANERRIYGYVRALIPNWSDVDDIIQESASVMWSKFNEFEKGSNFSAWALRIAHFQVLNYYKIKKHNKLYFSDETINSLSQKILSTNPNTDERLNVLKKCIHKLHDHERSLIELRYEPGATTKSVAHQTGKEVHALYKLFNKIHARLLLCVRRTLAEGELI
ncbi:MAG: sigma-70 family RNA polymerase sigma factor [Sedimentisphaerales bacterium]|nr:sigma-70 family RNA polymerase sigma factor [Sedimentisphaerales bacterium]